MAELNAKKIFDELENCYEEVVVLMDDPFTSHDFIEKLSQLNQDLYVQVLNLYIKNGQPFQSVHSVIAKRLKKHKELVRHIKNKSSENIFGLDNDAAVWQKV